MSARAGRLPGRGESQYSFESKNNCSAAQPCHAGREGVAMSNDPIFKDGQFAQAGVSFALPGLSNLLDRIGDLDSEKLEALAAANELPWHPGVPKQEVVFAVGAVLQTHWYIQKDGHVPGKVLQRKADQTARYEDLVRRFN